MAFFIRIAAATDLALITLHHCIPDAFLVLPLGGGALQQTALLIIAAVVLEEVKAAGVDSAGPLTRWLERKLSAYRARRRKGKDLPPGPQ